jgi:hypothetical protein
LVLVVGVTAAGVVGAEGPPVNQSNIPILFYTEFLQIGLKKGIYCRRCFQDRNQT